MKQNQELTFQVLRFILLVAGMLVGLGGLLLEAFPRVLLPSQLDLSLGADVAVLLTGVGYTAVILGGHWIRLAVAPLLMLLGGHGVVHHVADMPSSAFLSGYQPLPLLPSLLLMLFSGCCLLGLGRPVYRRAWRWVAGLSLLLGLTILVVRVWPVPVPEASGDLLSGLSPLGGLLSMALGMIMLIAARDHASGGIVLPASVLGSGGVGVVASLLIWLLGSWTYHLERRDEATHLVENLASMVERVQQEKVDLLMRMTERWQLSGGVPGELMGEVDTQSVLRDNVSLRALMVVDNLGEVQWQKAQAPATLHWMAVNLQSVEGLAWRRAFSESSWRMAWWFPDPGRPDLALLATRISSGLDQGVIGVIDFSRLIEGYVPTGFHDFRVAISLPEWDAITIMTHDGPHHDTEEVLGRAVAALPNGPSLTLSAHDGPASIATLAGALPPALGVMGLFFTYQVMVSRALASIRRQQAHALEVSEEHFRSLFSQTPNAALSMDVRGGVREANPAALATMGHRAAGRHFREVIQSLGSDTGPDIEEAFESAAAGNPREFEMRCRLGGELRDFEVEFLPIMVQGRVEGVFGIFNDITERMAAQEHLALMERSLEASSNGVLILDKRREGGSVVYVNPAVCRITGYAPEQILDQTPGFLAGPGTDPEDVAAIRTALSEGEELSLTLRTCKRDGTPFWNQVFLSPVRNRQGEMTHCIAVMNDISGRKAQEDQLAFQATHDVLTGLPNRSLFHDHLAHDFALARRHRTVLAVLFIDLDEFKPINDALGHEVGDRLLVSVAERLSQHLRTGDTLARVGGDEFLLLLPDVEHDLEAEHVAERLLEDLARPHTIHTHELHVSASIGLALLEDDRLQEAEKLVQQADMAMYKAKQQGRNTWQRFTSDLDWKLSQRVSLRNELQEALDRDLLQMYYQPLIDQRGRVCGAEALLRWPHPTRGWVSPAEFIPLAEETGQIMELSRWVMRRACGDTRRLVERGLMPGRVAINLSPMQFHRPNFLTTLRQLLDESGLSAEYVELELTESILMHDTQGAIEILEVLAEMGFSTAIDDFGTGYSSLSYIRSLPIDTIKIDRSFVQEVTENDKDAAICKGVITLAKELELRVLAEGIETEAQYEYLLSLGCEAFQGHWFAKPMSLEAFTAYLEMEHEACRGAP
ncbi:putative bifunctional diguanylate cyclase/phosphodiesterase [Halomonas maura]|uniref:putative bifunctional diguanylate cyclase/phosphodiesterase n=1 Tax=Halomonas maura TaxID=117606 RepID=UPI0025B2B07E|nr:EAL domain-containing protein [Halomonas maura]MDN3554482.1 EAL domain-containing protein [Halomonas maura]